MVPFRDAFLGLQVSKSFVKLLSSLMLLASPSPEVGPDPSSKHPCDLDLTLWGAGGRGTTLTPLPYCNWICCTHAVIVENRMSEYRNNLGASGQDWEGGGEEVMDKILYKNSRRQVTLLILVRFTHAKSPSEASGTIQGTHCLPKGRDICDLTSMYFKKPISSPRSWKRRNVVCFRICLSLQTRR